MSFCRTYGDERPQVDLVGFGVRGRLGGGGSRTGRIGHCSSGDRHRWISLCQTSIDHDLNLLPGGAKYGDLPGMLALAAPGELWLAGERAASAPLIVAVYQAAGEPSKLQFHDGPAEKSAEAAVRWLIAPVNEGAVKEV